VLTHRSKRGQARSRSANKAATAKILVTKIIVTKTNAAQKNRAETTENKTIDAIAVAFHGPPVTQPHEPCPAPVAPDGAYHSPYRQLSRSRNSVENPHGKIVGPEGSSKIPSPWPHGSLHWKLPLALPLVEHAQCTDLQRRDRGTDAGLPVESGRIERLVLIQSATDKALRLLHRRRKHHLHQRAGARPRPDVELRAVGFHQRLGQ